LSTDVASSASAVKSLEERVGALQFEMRLGELRDLASMMYLETSRKNFGIAQQTSSQFFTIAAELAAETGDQELKLRLEAIVAERDQVTASLAKADASSQESTLRLLTKIHENLGRK
jgi:hypothetical protein